MKKFYSLVAVLAITATASAQTNAFNGADFEDWSVFESSLNEHGVQDYATQGVGQGYNNTNSLNINTPSVSRNDYIFTAKLSNGLPTSISKITLWVKGTSSSKSLSFNVYKTTLDNKGRQDYYKFNVEDLADSNVTLSEVPSNQYNGSIDTKGKWVLITLNTKDLKDINLSDTSSNFFSLKIGKKSEYNLDIDDIKVYDANMNVYDLAGNKKSTLVKNTVVEDQLFFGAKSVVKIYNTNGQIVKSLEVKDGDVVNVSSLPKGVYIVAGEVNGQKVSQKVIKK